MRILVFTAFLASCALAVQGEAAPTQQDRSTLVIPDGGLSFAEFKGFEAWENVSVSQTDDRLKVIAGNPKMMEAYKRGLPSKGRAFPDGSKVVKIQWSRKPATADFPAASPGDLLFIEFMEKDSKRFPQSNGWAYASWKNDPVTGVLSPAVSGPGCGHACHTKVADEDFVFTHYPKH